MLRNNTFVTVTDSKGNVKLSVSAGSLKDLESGQNLWTGGLVVWD